MIHRRLMSLMFIFAILGMIAAPRAVHAQPELPGPPSDGWVLDQTGALTADEEFAINTQIKSLRDSNGAQFAVLIVQDCGGDVENYRHQVFNTWGIGQKGKDNGLLLLVCTATRDVQVETGRGIEGIIPDILANRGIDDYFVPKAKAGDMAGGVSDILAYFANLIYSEAEAEGAVAPEVNRLMSDQGNGGSEASVLLLFVCLLVIIVAFVGILYLMGIFPPKGPYDDDDPDNGSGDDDDDGGTSVPTDDPEPSGSGYQRPPSYSPPSSPSPSYRSPSRPYSSPSRPSRGSFGGGFGGGRSGGGGARGRF